MSQKVDPKPTGLIHRLVWCPFIPEEDADASIPEDEEVANMLVVTHGPKVFYLTLKERIIFYYMHFL